MGTEKHIAVVVKPLPDKRTFLWVTLLLLIAWSTFISPIGLSAAPFSDFIEFTQPDNTQITLWGEGDEFHADFETTEGYSVVFDPKRRRTTTPSDLVMVKNFTPRAYWPIITYHPDW